MTSEAEILEIVIDPMSAIFGRPYGCKTDEDVDKAQAQYLAALRVYPADILEQAWAEVRKTWTKTTWPPIGTIAQQADRILRDRHRERNRAEPDTTITWPKAVKMLWTMDSGRLAVERNVCEDFCWRAIELQAVPSRIEVVNMVHEPSGITDAELGALERGNSVQRVVARLGRAMQTKNADLREKALQHLEAFR